MPIAYWWRIGNRVGRVYQSQSQPVQVSVKMMKTGQSRRWGAEGNDSAQILFDQVFAMMPKFCGEQDGDRAAQRMAGDVEIATSHVDLVKKRQDRVEAAHPGRLVPEIERFLKTLVNEHRGNKPAIPQPDWERPQIGDVPIDILAGSTESDDDRLVVYHDAAITATEASVNEPLRSDRFTKQFEEFVVCRTRIDRSGDFCSFMDQGCRKAADFD